MSLREMHGDYKKVSHTPRVAVGDVVVIHSDKQARGQWKLGRVEELLTGPDGQHGAAVVRVAGQKRTAKHLRRPVQKLYPVEMSVSADTEILPVDPTPLLEDDADELSEAMA